MMPVAESGWTVDTVRGHLEAQLAGLDRRVEQRFVDQEKAVNAALAAAQQAVNAALAAAEKAVDKAEVAATAKFEAVNEFRGQLSDQALTFMPRAEAEIRLSALAEKVDTLTGGSNRMTGRSAGMNASWLVLVGAAGLVLTVFSIVSVVVSLTN